MSHYQRIAAAENVEAEEEALRMIASAAEGSVRDGLSMLDQAIAHGEGKVRLEDVCARCSASRIARVSSTCLKL